MIHLSHKIELDPTVAQVKYFTKACGVARFAYNWALAEWGKQYKAGEKPSKNKLNKHLNAIKAIEFHWMYEVTKRAPQQSIINLGEAFDHYFKDLKKPKKQRRFKRPSFKKKGIHDSFRADDGPQDSKSSSVKFEGKSVLLPIIGLVRMKEALRFKGRILSVVISRTAHKWFASFSIELDHIPIRRENQTSIGVDLGIKDLATLSDGTKFENPKVLRSNLKKLKRLQRSLSRKIKGSSNRKKAKLKLARLHYRISCIRKDTLHKLTHYLVKNYTLIGIEDLNVSGMMKNRKLSQAISDVGFYEFKRQLLYKAELYGSTVVIADRWFPSSKTCSNCGLVNPTLELSERSWRCTECGAEHDRDTNAAINLKFLAESSSATRKRQACGEDVRLNLSIEQTSMKQEPGKSYV